MTVLLLAIVKFRCFGEGHQGIQPGVSLPTATATAPLVTLRCEFGMTRPQLSAVAQSAGKCGRRYRAGSANSQADGCPTSRRGAKADRLRANATINDTLLHYVQDDLPFGGLRPSGMGSIYSVP